MIHLVILAYGDRTADEHTYRAFPTADRARSHALGLLHDLHEEDPEEGRTFDQFVDAHAREADLWARWGHWVVAIRHLPLH